MCAVERDGFLDGRVARTVTKPTLDSFLICSGFCHRRATVAVAVLPIHVDIMSAPEADRIFVVFEKIVVAARFRLAALGVHAGIDVEGATTHLFSFGDCGVHVGHGVPVVVLES